MKKLLLASVGTVAVTTWLFTYRTSTAGPLPAGTLASSGSATTPVASGGVLRPDPARGPVTQVKGDQVPTRWGPVRVQLDVQAGTIVRVTLLEQPHDNAMDVFIANRSVPKLIAETLAAQDAHIDMVTGATFTSTGYVASLQSALDRAHLGGR